MRLSQLTALSTLFTICLGCDGMAADQGRTHPWARVATETQIARTLVDLNNIVDSQIAAFQGAPGPTHEYQFIPAAPLESSKGQRILILETRLGMPSSAFGRHKHKIMGVYDFPNNQTPHLKEQFPIERQSVLLRQVGDFLAELPYYVPPQHISGVYQKLVASGNREMDSVLALPSNGIASHIDTIFEILANFNPEAQFVIAASGGGVVLGGNRFCGFHNDELYEEARVMNNHAALKVLGLIRRFDINYISISEGWHYERFAQSYGRLCKSHPLYRPIKKIPHEKVLRYLSLPVEYLQNITRTSPNVLIFKSIPNNENHVDFGLKDRWSEPEALTSMPGVIKVGFFSTPHFDVSGGVSEDLSFLSWEQRVLGHASDIFINGGFEEINNKVEAPLLPETALRDMYLGLSVDHLRVMSTSWATPVALSFANRLHLDGKWNTSEELRTLLKSGNTAKLYDPIKERLLELYPLEQH